MKPYIVLGATGHIGKAVIKALVAKNLPVTGVTSRPENIAELEALGAQGVVADIRDVEKLRELFKSGSRLFILNPPAPPASDIVAEETKNIHAILVALEGSGLEWIVADSTYGAQQGVNIADLGVLFELEASLKQQQIPFTVLRGAYYYTNWDALLDAARKGELPTVYPAGFKLPMVSPGDIGQYAAELLSGPVEQIIIHSIEGPEHYSPADVATAFQTVLGTPVKVAPVARAHWNDFFEKAGYSAVSAEYMINMTLLTLENKEQIPGPVKKGKITIREYLEQLVSANQLPQTQ